MNDFFPHSATRLNDDFFSVEFYWIMLMKSFRRVLTQWRMTMNSLNEWNFCFFVATVMRERRKMSLNKVKLNENHFKQRWKNFASKCTWKVCMSMKEMQEMMRLKKNKVKLFNIRCNGVNIQEISHQHPRKGKQHSRELWVSHFCSFFILIRNWHQCTIALFCVCNIYSDWEQL